MLEQSDLIKEDILAYLAAQERKDLLRFITCGSVDDGKSTLIGRLLYESKLIYEDQLAALEKDSKKLGTQGDQIDFALLVDGLASEREQGITIDVAYRYFSTEKRKFIVADTPGHEQYTRNMATGASTAELAILMIDARQGVLTQTRRHSAIVKMLGVDKVVLAINKMDLCAFSQVRFDEICQDYAKFAKEIDLESFVSIPVSALKGDNIVSNSASMPWYQGPSLMEYLENCPLKDHVDQRDFSMPVQWVNRPNLDFRGFTGQITTGRISKGDKIQVLPSMKCSTVKEITLFDRSLSEAIQGQSINLTLEDELDISRGDIIVSPTTSLALARSFRLRVLWMSEDALKVGASYWIKTRAKMFTGVFQKPEFKIDINSLESLETDTLSLNEIGDCVCDFDQLIPFEKYVDNPHLGSLIIIDRQSNNTVGMALIESSIAADEWVEKLVKDRNKYWSRGLIDGQLRQQRFGHPAKMLVITGQSSREDFAKVAIDLEKKLFEKGLNCYRYGFQFLRQEHDDINSIAALRLEMFQQLSDISYAFLDAGFIFITVIRDLKLDEYQRLQRLSAPYEFLVMSLDDAFPQADIFAYKDDIFDFF